MKMSIYLILVFSFLVLGGCKHKHSEQESSAQIEEVKLDQGKKWKADQQTNGGAAKLQSIVAEFSKETPKPELEDYKRLNTQVQTELDEIFKKCTMTGDAHQQLHVFLVRIIKDVNVLKEDDLKASDAAFQSMQKNLATYTDYFE
ncbi:hypothetical protein JNM05_05115 [bacterium]|nr:hypothetical protein [bacterium]